MKKKVSMIYKAVSFAICCCGEIVQKDIQLANLFYFFWKASFDWNTIGMVTALELGSKNDFVIYYGYYEQIIKLVWDSYVTNHNHPNNKLTAAFI